MSLDVTLGPARVRFTGRAEGDLGHGGGYVHAVRPGVAARRQAVVDLPWTWLRQVHGDDVVTVPAPGGGAGSTADAAITRVPGAAIAVLTADCAPVALADDDGVIGIAHAGWTGLLAGVLQRTVKEMRSLGACDVRAVLGPCIRAECYDFGQADLQKLTDRYGPTLAARTTSGNLALDLPAGVRAALGEEGVDAVDDVRACTACSDHYFSWRARREQARQAGVVWREDG